MVLNTIDFFPFEAVKITWETLFSVVLRNETSMR